MYIMLSFLELNGINILATNDEVYSLGMAVADGSKNNEDILKWIKEHETQSSRR